MEGLVRSRVGIIADGSQVDEKPGDSDAAISRPDSTAICDVFCFHGVLVLLERRARWKIKPAFHKYTKSIKPYEKKILLCV